jgi:RNA polymerase sigma-70 factor, ECF subfamily
LYVHTEWTSRRHSPPTSAFLPRAVTVPCNQSRPERPSPASRIYAALPSTNSGRKPALIASAWKKANSREPCSRSAPSTTTVSLRGVQATRSQIVAFWRALQLAELALAQACALGRDIAWQRFLACYREPLTQAAIGIAGSVALGRELADSLYPEIFGLSERNGQRQSPLATYSGRGSLKGFLRATLAQRNVDRHRRTRRETSLSGEDWAAPAAEPAPAQDALTCLYVALTATLGALDAEARFLLAAWFLDGHTLLAISRILGVHEATVSRRIQRLTLKARKELLKNLQSSGMSRAAAEEALAIDPRYVDLNLRRILQASRPNAFSSVDGLAETDQT